MIGTTNAAKQYDWKLIWENASPTSAFAAQTVALDLSAYQEVRVLFKTYNTGNNNNSYPFDGMIGFAINASLTAVNDSGANFTFQRFCTVNTSGITFNDCFDKATNVSATKTTDNARLVPTYIYAR